MLVVSKNAERDLRPKRGFSGGAAAVLGLKAVKSGKSRSAFRPSGRQANKTETNRRCVLETPSRSGPVAYGRNPVSARKNRSRGRISELGALMEELRTVLTKHGFRFKKQFGQNFISDANLLKSIVSASGVTKDATVVEIGCGAGTLTRALAESAKRVYAFEIDVDLKPVLEETLSGLENVEVIFRDFNKLALREWEKEIGAYMVVANLPYYITTPLVAKLLDESELCEGVSVMVQEEVAERFCAKEDTPEYGAITAGIALKGSAKIVKRVPRTLFYPRPNVDSAVVKIDFERGRLPVKSEKLYRDTVRCAFLNRRKTLQNNLMLGFSLSREQAKEVLERAGVDEKARGETLSPRRLAALSDVLWEYGGGAEPQKGKEG